MHRYYLIALALLCLVLHKANSAVTDCQLAPVAGIGQLEVTAVASPALPAFCQVKGVLEGRIRFEARLPLEGWNGKFLMAGCGGFCGSLLPDKPGFSNSINEALKMGYAAIAHDGGHRGASHDTAWAYHDRQALEIWAHRILPIVARNGKAIVTAFYGRPPALSYFSGCSNGGRLGLMAAQRYPQLFDGILAGAPVFDLSGNAGIYAAWKAQQLYRADGTLRLGQEKIPLLKSYVLRQCDGLDGLADGIIAAPGRCQVDLSTLRCRPGVPADDCLSGGQITLLNRLYHGVSDSKGERLYPGISYGSEHYFATWIIGKPGQPAWGTLAGQGYLNLVNEMAPDQHYAMHRFDVDKDPELLREHPLAAMMDATSTDLSALVGAGTKLIIWHGWSDPLILPKRTVDYYEAIARKLGGMGRARERVRLFLLPGHGHCWRQAAEAPDQFNPIQLLADWVESGSAPSQFIAHQQDAAGNTLRSRPICAYPAVARYQGTGDMNDAASFVCEINGNSSLAK